MSVLPVGFGASGAGYQIANSLRVDGVDDYLSRTFGTPSTGGNIKWALLIRCKRGALGTNQILFSAFGDGSNYFDFRFNTSDQLFIQNRVGGVNLLVANTTAVFRDPTAWLNILFVFDSANGTAAYRNRLYVNDVEYTWSANSGASDACAFNVASRAHYIGASASAGMWGYLSGYGSDVYFLDAPSAVPTWETFGEHDGNGVYVPKQHTGTYGNNGVYLNFKDGTSATTLGYDAAGSNDWTLNGMTRAAGVNECWMVDTPTDNFATLNPLDYYDTAPTNGNLRLSRAAGVHAVATATIPFPETSEWACEATITTVRAAAIVTAICISKKTAKENANSNPDYYPEGYSYINTGQKGNNNTYSAYGASYTTGDVIGVVYSAGSLTFYKNGVSQGVAYSGLSGTFRLMAYSNGDDISFNFGQRPFAYSYGDALPLSTANLPAVAIPDPSLHFDVVLDTGANIKTAMDALFSGNVFEWIKDRANSNNHQLADVNRGLTAILQSNTTAAETTYSAPSGSSVGWGWKAGGAGVSNTDGSITSTVSANVEAGLSIVTYTGTGANATVGHGLGDAPKMVLIKWRSGSVGSGQFIVGHQGVDSASPWNYYLSLNATDARTISALPFNNTAPTSSVISVGTGSAVNDASDLYVAYCFAEIPGYSKFGSYVGNGSADGPFVFCGFRPRYVLYKPAIGGTGHWEVFDTARSGYNVADDVLWPSSSGAETASSSYYNDILSNGLKVRTTDTSMNATGVTYIFAAFAEHPFGGSNVSPSPAR